MDFSKQLQKAQEAFRRRNYDFAIDLYRSLLDIDPDLGEARAGLRQALKKREERKKGGKLFKVVGGAAPLARAKTMRKLGKHDACARALDDYLKSNPLDPEGNLLLGMSLEDGGHLKSARAVYEFLAEIAPDNPEGLKRAGAMMHQTGDHDRALEYYERALTADPRDQEALKARKNLAADMAISSSGAGEVQHSREQIADKDEAMRLERAQRRVLSREELEAELVRLEARFAEEPRDVELMIEIAGVHEKLRDPAAALDLVERALSYRREDPLLAEKRVELAVKVLKKRIAKADAEGRPDEATRLEEELRRVQLDEARARAAARPQDGSLRLELGKRLLFGGEVDEALAELQKAAADARLKGEATFLLAQCFQRKGIWDLAQKQYEQALDECSGVDERAKEILYNLGSIAEERGDPARAREFYVRVYEVDIGYRDVSQKMEQLSAD